MGGIISSIFGAKQAVTYSYPVDYDFTSTEYNKSRPKSTVN